MLLVDYPHLIIISSARLWPYTNLVHSAGHYGYDLAVSVFFNLHVVIISPAAFSTPIGAFIGLQSNLLCLVNLAPRPWHIKLIVDFLVNMYYIVHFITAGMLYGPISTLNNPFCNSYYSNPEYLSVVLICRALLSILAPVSSSPLPLKSTFFKQALLPRAFTSTVPLERSLESARDKLCRAWQERGAVRERVCVCVWVCNVCDL